MELKVCKFGGTSMADGTVISSCVKIVEADANRRYVVVSAPGKRFSGDIKVTDLLYALYDAYERGDTLTFDETFEKIAKRFLDIQREIGKELGVEKLLEEVKTEILKGAGKNYCVSRGEYIAAQIMAAMLGVPFVDATEFIRFDERGLLKEETYELAESVLERTRRAVVPGFYGLGADGKVKTFSRGGGDISGAVVARGVRASLYENWTDVSGFYVCDPRIVNAPKCIEELSYRELRELSYMGANVLHSDSIFPVKSAGIPIRICNTFRPEEKGTYIVPTIKRKVGERAVTGVAGKTGFTTIAMEKSMMNAEVGFVQKVLSIIESHGVSLEHLPSGIDSMSVVIDNTFLKEGEIESIVKEIKEAVKVDRIYVHKDVALVTTVGHGMAKNIGIASRVFKALYEAGVNVNMIDLGPSELNLIVGVAAKDCAACIRAIYHEFF